MDIAGKSETKKWKSNQGIKKKVISDSSLFPLSENNKNSVEKTSFWSEIINQNSKLSTMKPQLVSSHDKKYHKINKETLAKRFQKLVNFRKKNATMSVKTSNNLSSIESSKKDRSTMTVKFTSLPESVSESVCTNK